ncbi:McrB family protein [Nostoc sp.]|uniref:McrB family protein n=1 Tax=Nostoc sp. TaxID=1180 RepID=UPI002FF7C1D4
MLADNQSEFVRLFQEFLISYPYTACGISHTNSYTQQRQQRRRNFEVIAAAADSGENVTESLLLPLLLPYDNNTKNPQRGVWIHIASSVAKDIKELFEGAKWAKPEDWPQIYLAIWNFVRGCNDNPEQLSAACKEFSQMPYSKDFQTEILTPVLNSLRPDEFLLLNNKSLRVINYFANTDYKPRLTDYPAVNSTGHKLIKEFAKVMRQPGVPALRDDDLFDMFSHWVVAVKKYDFSNYNVKNTTYWRKEIKSPEYTLSQLTEEIGLKETIIERWIRTIDRKGQAILYGSPGTGKTYIAEKLAQHLIGGGDGLSELVQFHPVYSYEDFIQGIRPQSQNGILAYPLVPGRFLEFCKKAESREHTCVLIIDEINRANLAQVFGELMYLLEYRDREIPLAGGNRFSIPKNVRIIGTMNTADRSIANIDHALRRRFAFIELRPNYEVLRSYHLKTGFAVEGLIKILQQLNQAIADKNYEIGISFFLTDNLREDIEDIWRMEIEPYLEEYFFNQLQKVDKFRWDEIKDQVQLWI